MIRTHSEGNTHVSPQWNCQRHCNYFPRGKSPTQTLMPKRRQWRMKRDATKHTEIPEDSTWVHLNEEIISSFFPAFFSFTYRTLSPHFSAPPSPYIFPFHLFPNKNTRQRTERNIFALLNLWHFYIQSFSCHITIFTIIHLTTLIDLKLTSFVSFYFLWSHFSIVTRFYWKALWKFCEYFVWKMIFCSVFFFP